jgi:hypothetical protein
MSEAGPDLVACRLCDARVARDATVCPSCGVKTPWIPDEPGMNPRVLWIAIRGGALTLLILLLLVLGMLMFGPATENRGPDHRHLAHPLRLNLACVEEAGFERGPRATAKPTTLGQHGGTVR